MIVNKLIDPIQCQVSYQLQFQGTNFFQQISNYSQGGDSTMVGLELHEDKTMLIKHIYIEDTLLTRLVKS